MDADWNTIENKKPSYMSVDNDLVDQPLENLYDDKVEMAMVHMFNGQDPSQLEKNKKSKNKDS